MNLREFIHSVNTKGEKVLSIYLTAGYPSPDRFVELALAVLKSGADMLEIGIPFSDPLADGPIIQDSSNAAISAGVTLPMALEFTKRIAELSGKPVIPMTYMNPVVRFGIEKFAKAYRESLAAGLIIPDIIQEEIEQFPGLQPLKNVLCGFLSPTTPETRIQQCDAEQWSFIYYVSMLGTTGRLGALTNQTTVEMKRVRNLVNNNKLLAGFGISTPEDIRQIRDYCDGVIVGSAVIKMLKNNPDDYSGVENMIKDLKAACR